MDCPICGAVAETSRTQFDSVSIACPICGEFDVASSVIASGQLQGLALEERADVLGRGATFGGAGRSSYDHSLFARIGRVV
jgi:hypothetical protein